MNIIDKSFFICNWCMIKGKTKKFNEELRSLEYQLQEKKNGLPNLKLDLPKLEMDSNTCVRHIADVEKRISELWYVRIIFLLLNFYQDILKLIIVINNFFSF